MRNNNNFNKSEARDWAVTVNNPKMSNRDFFDYVKSLTGAKYFVLSLEHGDGTPANPSGTIHQHLYVEFSTPRRFDTVKNYFSEDTIGVNAHISKREGSRLACVNYVKKEGNHTDKSHTRVDGVMEFGDFSQGGQRTDINVTLRELYDMKKTGVVEPELFNKHPHVCARFYDYLDRLSFREKTERYKYEERDVEVVYIYGKAGIGKSRYIVNKHGNKNVCRITEYRNGSPIFDHYNGQDVLVFEEFRSKVEIDSLLSLIDRYPIELPARYHDRTACFTKVYIVSNIPIYEQYPNVLEEKPETYNAFLRRIKKIYNFNESKDESIDKLWFTTHPERLNDHGFPYKGDREHLISYVNEIGGYWLDYEPHRSAVKKPF